MQEFEKEASPRVASSFLQADWTDLFIVSFPADSNVLAPYVPSGTSIDLYEGTAVMSIVAFRFSRIRVHGVPIPFCGSFSQVNLRFYVKEDSTGVPGVVFIKEFCPHAILSLGARILYGENYHTVPTSYRNSEARGVAHRWGGSHSENVVKARVLGALLEPRAGSFEDFVINRYAAFRKKSHERTLKFEIAHRPWRILETEDFCWRLDGRGMYGEELGRVLEQEPVSAFLVDGSAVDVSRQQTLKLPERLASGVPHTWQPV